MDFEKLIERCKSEMKRQNLTNRDVARLANISEPTISRTLSGNGMNTSVSTLAAICDALSIGEESAPAGCHTHADAIQEARIADLKSMIAHKDKWIRALFVVCLVFVAFVAVALAVDLTNPSVGWVRG